MSECIHRIPYARDCDACGREAPEMGNLRPLRAQLAAQHKKHEAEVASLRTRLSAAEGERDQYAATLEAMNESHTAVVEKLESATARATAERARADAAEARAAKAEASLAYWQAAEARNPTASDLVASRAEAASLRRSLAERDELVRQVTAAADDRCAALRRSLEEARGLLAKALRHWGAPSIAAGEDCGPLLVQRAESRAAIRAFLATPSPEGKPEELDGCAACARRPGGFGPCDRHLPDASATPGPTREGT